MLSIELLIRRVQSYPTFCRRRDGLAPHRSRLILLLLALLLSLALAVPSSAAITNYKLSDSANVLAGDVITFQISPNNSRVVYLADQEADGVDELYSVPLDGSGSPLKLNGSLAGGGDVFSFQISPDSSRVVYWADQEADGVTELYSVPLDGSSSPLKLNGSLASGGDVWGFQISPDSSQVVYGADQETVDVDELYSVPLDGSGSPLKLNGSLAGGGDVYTRFQISPDSSRVVYLADQETNDVVELYSRPLGGSDRPLKLNGSLVSGGDVQGAFQISPDSSRVVYRADQETDEVVELYASTGFGGTMTGSSTFLPLILK